MAPEHVPWRRRDAGSEPLPPGSNTPMSSPWQDPPRHAMSARPFFVRSRAPGLHVTTVSALGQLSETTGPSRTNCQNQIHGPRFSPENIGFGPLDGHFDREISTYTHNDPID